ncbi:MAG TPA: hypothetical protein VES40_13890 [Ilumatobacteraceae bacterium]|nr:hypothetical protein [Ilumatobacteraceae bacterium]
MTSTDVEQEPEVDVVVVDVEGPRRWVRAALVGVVVLPIVTAVVRSLRRDWFPIGDNALLYLRAVDVFTEHHPLLGSWTSASLSVGENMNNPGALYDLLMAPFALTLAPGPGAAIGVGVLNIASIIGISIASRHIGGWRMQRWMLLATAALAWSMGSEMLFDIWQAHALLLPFLALLVLMVGCTAGRRACVPWAVFVASVLIQTHISYAYVLSALVVAALAISWWLHRPVERAAVTSALRSRTAIITAIVFVLCWIQPLYEQFFGDGRGNLTRLASNSGGGDVTLGLTDATKITSAIIALPPWWMRSGYSTTVPITQVTPTDDGYRLVIAGLPGLATSVLALIAVISLLVALTIAAHRRGLLAATCAGALCAVSVPITVVALSQLTIGTVGFSSHHVRWVWPLSVFITFSIVWIATEIWTATRTPEATGATGAGPDRSAAWFDRISIGLIVVLSIANIAYLERPDGPVAAYSKMAAMRRVLPQIGVLGDHDPVVYDVSNLRVFEPYSSTMMMRMQELGVEFRVTDEGLVRQLGPSRRADGTETTRVFQLEGIDALDYGGPACTVALASALTADDEAATRDLADRLAADLADGTIVIDEGRLTEADPIDQLAAARAGDLDAAWLLVIDGSLATWVAEGIADSTRETDLGVDMDRVIRWQTTSYGLFAEGPWACPS